MRRSLLPLLASLGLTLLFVGSSCGSRDAGGNSDASVDAGSNNDAGNQNDGGGPADAGDGGLSSPPGFMVQSPEIDVPASTEFIACYYFHTPNDADINVKTWKSTLTTGLADVSVLFTATDRASPGTVSFSDCSLLGAFNDASAWAYSTWKKNDGWSFPADDGTGKPVGKPVKAQQSGYLLIHAINASDTAIKVRATLEATGYPLGTVITQAESFVTYNTAIQIPAMGTGSAQNTCPVPEGAHFTWLTTYSRKASVQTSVKDTTSTLFESTNFENPGAATWAQAPFGTVAGNQVSVKCDYENHGNGAVTAGDSSNDEACMMLGFHFPATKSRLSGASETVVAHRLHTALDACFVFRAAHPRRVDVEAARLQP